MENWQTKKLIKSLEEAVETIKKLNEELETFTKNCEVTDEQKMRYKRIISDYCDLHGIETTWYDNENGSVSTVDYYSVGMNLKGRIGTSHVVWSTSEITTGIDIHLEYIKNCIIPVDK